MGDSSTCLMQPLSYASVLSPAEAIEGNPLHALGQSVSFGRFTSESLSWEKWSTFSHRRHVEEAERYSRPGSVAEKKAFFEAHYKKIAEKKKAEAALLEQANAAEGNALGSVDVTDSYNSISENMDLRKEEAQTQITCSHSVSMLDKTNIHCKEDGEKELEKEKTTMHDVDNSPFKSLALKSKEDNFSTPKSETTATNSSSAHKWLKPLNSTPVKELNLSSKVKWKVDNIQVDGNCAEASKDFSTPSKFPVTKVPNSTSALGSRQSEHRIDLPGTRKNNTAAESLTGVKRSLATKCSKFLKVCKNKLQPPKISTPSGLRTEDRVARRETLKDKFDAEKAQNALPRTKLKGIAETESRKWHLNFCSAVGTEDPTKKVPTSHQPQKSGRKQKNGTGQDAPLPSQTTPTEIKGIQEVPRKKFADHVPISCSRECHGCS